jgi:aldehyde:ferredoxin oxidoreductase
MKTKYGYMGRILWVDLTNKTFKDEIIPDETYQQFLSGYGLASKIIYERQPKGIDHTDERSIISVMSGILTNTKATFNGRWMLAGKSPLTGCWGDANCGGNFGPAIKKTGYDGIFIIGKSDTPVYIYIDDEKQEILPADDLWLKKDAVETEELLTEKYGDTSRVISIGSAGENGSLISGVVNDSGRLAARSGLGALFGVKKVKAICLNASQEVHVHDEKSILKKTKQLNKDINMSTDPFCNTMKWSGTAGTTADSVDTGDTPIKNWKGVAKNDFPHNKSSKISGYSVTKYQDKEYYCEGCTFGCGGICSLKNNPLLKKTHRPEYEILSGFGAQLLCDNVEDIFEINEKLNRAGFDAISVATTVNWAFEAFEQGLFKEKFPYLELKWGDSKAVVNLVDDIIANKDLGFYLKDGVKKAAEYFDKEGKTEAMHVHGQELPMHDSRRDGSLGLGVGYEVEPTPGRHTATNPQWEQMAEGITINSIPNNNKLNIKFQRKYLNEYQSHEEQGRDLMYSSCCEDIINGAGLCNFSFMGSDVPVVSWLNGVTGWNNKFTDYIEIGQRIKTVRHAFNLREGIDTANIKVPDRARGNHTLKDGPNAYSPNVLKWDDAKTDYYLSMGWNPQTTIPLKETLTALNLDFIKNDFYKK